MFFDSASRKNLVSALRTTRGSVKELREADADIREDYKNLLRSLTT